MGWFRTNRRCGGRLALFALALQLFLSFGHIHREDIYGPSRSNPAQVATALPASDGSAPLPSDQPAKHGDDYCPICATIHMLGNSTVGAPPQLVLALVSLAVEHADRATIVFIAPRRAPFQSRAPPIA